MCAGRESQRAEITSPTSLPPLDEARALLWDWLRANNWRALQPPGGLSYGGDEELWTKVFESQPAAQIVALWEAAQRAEEAEA
jgi:hypothetical protein